jgi:DNA-directed RNA polymerase subunit N (RpoN/RPB10)
VKVPFKRIPGPPPREKAVFTPIKRMEPILTRNIQPIEIPEIEMCQSAINTDFQINMRYKDHVSLKQIFRDIETHVDTKHRAKAFDSLGIYIYTRRFPFGKVTADMWRKYQTWLLKQKQKEAEQAALFDLKNKKCKS